MAKGFGLIHCVCVWFSEIQYGLWGQEQNGRADEQKKWEAPWGGQRTLDFAGGGERVCLLGYHKNGQLRVALTYINIAVLVTQSCPTLRDPMDCSLSGSSVHGILQARILEWVATPFSKGFSQPRGQTWISCIAGRSLPSEPPAPYLK